MNELSFRSRGYGSSRTDQAARPDDDLDLEQIWTIVRRNLKLVGAFVAAALALGIVYLYFAPPIFTSETHVLVDEKIGEVAGSTSPVAGDMQMDTRIASEIEVLKSMRLALTVVDAENLTGNETFQNPPPSPIALVLAPLQNAVGYFRGTKKEAETDPAQAAAVARQEAAARLRQELVVERVERSSVIGITYASYDPNLAYRVTQAYADAFLQEQKLANASASTDATAWMKGRLAQLSAQQKKAALAVEDFRQRNGLSVARGELVSEQRLSDLTSQVALAQAELARSKAQSEQLAAIIASGTENAVKSIALSNSEIPDPVVQQLRGRYLEIARRISQITTDFGPNHPQAIQLRKEQDNLATRLFQQLQDLDARFKNDFEVAKSRLDTLEGIMSQQTGQNLQSGQAMVELRKLEQDAATVNTVYTNFLSRYEEAVQRQNSPVTDLRLISNATVPQEPTGPRFSLTMLTFAVLGALCGSAAGALREFNERSFRTGDDVVNHLGIRFLGYLPRLPKRAQRKASRDGTIAKNGWPFDIGVGPETAFAETLRNVAHAFPGSSDRGRANVIGIISVLPGEGKTTLSAQFARLLAASGFRTILLDADMRRPALSQSLPDDDGAGLVEAIRGRPWRPLVSVEPASGLSILRAGQSGDAAGLGSVMLASPGMATFMDELRREFDYVVVDLPPIGPVVDAKAFQTHVNGFVLALRWGQTPRKLVRAVLSDSPDVATKIVGAVLNATDLGALERYGARGSRERAYRIYQSYYTRAS